MRDDGAGRARRAIAATRARACEENDAAAYLAVALAPAAVVGLDGRAAAHFLCHLDAVMGGARARCGFSQCDGCQLLLAACCSPRLLLRASSAALVGDAGRGSPGWGQNTQTISH